ncbi:hypothetical protein SO694_00055295 [Aureococcus anophagefferens]|uniref:PPM-type phosphatase domain-containing protein n=1 Tax=Aureococcus anophagefferens TaxID=44056 RepID=A0ABR1FXI8_AURAN|nr:protein serine/threonine phosphatase [Aureococcus anophagefferens]KAH8071764.1 protein serine/threonine phosphatase [Aureococcus anophagefferens]
MVAPQPPQQPASSRSRARPSPNARRISLLEPGSDGEDEVAASETFVQADEIHVPRWALSARRRVPLLRVAGGRAKVNQDRGCVVQPYGGDRKCALFAVFDGHGSRGEVVAQFCMNFVKERRASCVGS